MKISTSNWRAVPLAMTLLLATTPAIADETGPTFTQRALRAMNESSPVGMVDPAARRPGFGGWFRDAWDGSKRIFDAGSTDLLLPFFTFHPAYKYPNRTDNNNYPLGAGVARTVIDAKDNERIVYALAFADSHYDYQPMIGYAWMARWPLGAGLKAGLGYTVLLTARSDANYIPFPAVLPLASFGTDRVNVYTAWIPSTEVLFFFARVSLPFKDSEPVAAAGTGAMAFGAADPDQRSRENLVYAAGAWVNTDAAGIDSVASGNSWAPMLGLRHFVNDRIAVDISLTRSTHSLDLQGERLGNFDQTPLSVAAQYYFPAYRSLRVYAGAGVAYSKVSQQDLPGYALSGHSIHPLVQAGLIYPLTDSLVLTGGLTVNFPRYQLSDGVSNLGTVRLSSGTFSLGLGYAY